MNIKQFLANESHHLVNWQHEKFKLSDFSGLLLFIYDKNGNNLFSIAIPLIKEYDFPYSFYENFQKKLSQTHTVVNILLISGILVNYGEGYLNKHHVLPGDEFNLDTSTSINGKIFDVRLTIKYKPKRLKHSLISSTWLPNEKS